MTEQYEPPRVVVVGGGPAGLMAAEAARAAGASVTLCDRMGSVGRKFLLAGKGGLNLTHGEGLDAFLTRFSARTTRVHDCVQAFPPQAIRDWARELSVDTVIGSSGRVFPVDHKAAPLLRGWVRRLRASGVVLRMHHDMQGWSPGDGGCLQLRFSTPGGELQMEADAAVLAFGGGSWPRLGSDGAWVKWLGTHGIDVAPLAPSNCGFEVDWSDHLRQRFAGAPLKPVTLRWTGVDGRPREQRGECIVTEHGLEGGVIYAAAHDLREVIAREGHSPVEVDLFPDRDIPTLQAALARPRGKRSLPEHWRRALGLQNVRAALAFECTPPEARHDAARMAQRLKALPLTLLRPRPLAEAISSAGGVRLEALDANLMLASHPGVFCAGEMLDWDAPTGGYLLSASLATGRRAGQAAGQWRARREPLC